MFSSVHTFPPFYYPYLYQIWLVASAIVIGPNKRNFELEPICNAPQNFFARQFLNPMYLVEGFLVDTLTNHEKWGWKPLDTTPFERILVPYCSLRILFISLNRCILCHVLWWTYFCITYHLLTHLGNEHQINAFSSKIYFSFHASESWYRWWKQSKNQFFFSPIGFLIGLTSSLQSECTIVLLNA